MKVPTKLPLVVYICIDIKLKIKIFYKQNSRHNTNIYRLS